MTDGRRWWGVAAWLQRTVLVAIGVAAGLVMAGHLAGRTALFHLSAAGIKWTEVVSSVAASAAASVTVIAVALATREYRKRQRDATALAVSRCDLSVSGECFRYEGRHLLRIYLGVHNRSTSQLKFAEDNPPFVLCHRVAAEMLGALPTVSEWDAMPPLKAVEVLHGNFLEPDEQLTHSILIPIDDPKQVVAYRIEFGIEVLEKTDGELYDWRAIDFAPVDMVSLSDGHPRPNGPVDVRWASRRRWLRWAFG